MTRQSAPHNFRRLGVVNRRGAQAVEAKDGFIGSVFNRKEGFRSAALVALAGVAAQEFVQLFVAAIERFPIMFLADRLLVP